MGLNAESKICGKEFECPNCHRIVKKGEPIWVKQDSYTVHGRSRTCYLRWHNKCPL
jgi:hypothetical protein